MNGMGAERAPQELSDNAELARYIFARLNDHDLEAVKPFWTDRTVERFPDRTAYGAAEIAAYFQALFTALPDWHMEIIALAADGENVFVRWQLTGSHRGELLGLAPTGKQINVEGVDHMVIRDGKIVSNTIILDQLEYVRQLGMMPPAGSTLERAMKSAFNVRTALAERFAR
jgi:steroid delta-isomerase-like uncharacterized protein